MNNGDSKSVQHILSLSYGKDSLACLGACKLLGYPIDRIIHAEVWATDNFARQKIKSCLYSSSRVFILSPGLYFLYFIFVPHVTSESCVCLQLLATIFSFVIFLFVC